MAPSVVRSTSDQERVRTVLQFLGLGFIDYIGARTLLRSELPLQGAVLASTAVEKYFKAIAAVGGIRLYGHLAAKHVESIAEYVPDLFAKLNPEFLKFLQRCYVLRYTDTLKPGFTLKVFARETLAELDQTLFHCEFQVDLRGPQGQEIDTSFRSALRKRRPRLVADNHVLENVPKTAFLQHRDHGYAILNRPEEGLLEVDFVVPESPMDGQFNRPGISPVPGPTAVVKARGSS